MGNAISESTVYIIFIVLSGQWKREHWSQGAGKAILIYPLH